MSFVSTEAGGRSEQFSRNVALETLLQELNSELNLAENSILSKTNSQQKLPLILVMGPMRSGTTLFSQWLANTGLVSYPTNLLSRFYNAPILGAKIQLLLTDPRYNFRDELGEFSQQSEYTSENGKTKGALAPNEFWYFWRRFFSEKSRDVWTDEELGHTMDTDTMIAELIGVMDVFQKPFLAKGMLFNYNIPFLDSVFEKAIFVQLQREPITNVASVLDARLKQLGQIEKWYSFKIPEYEQLIKLQPLEQVSGQVYYINEAVKSGIKNVSLERKLVVDYEEFCENPENVFDELLEKLAMQGYSANTTYNGPEKFDISRKAKPEEINRAYENFINKRL